MLLENFPKIAEYMEGEDVPFEKRKWLHIDREETAVTLAVFHTLVKNAISNNVTLRKQSKEETENAYNFMREYAHVCTREEAQAKLNISNVEFYKLFKQVDPISEVLLERM